MNLIFIKDFNNYFDRIVKNHNYINDYIDNRSYQIIENVNFEEKNRIDTTHIVNWKHDWVPNYMLAVEGETILSKWFVLEWDKIRGRQFKAILKGDVIAMNLEQIKNSPIFVEKGILPISNPLLFNSENGSYNQIKQRETLLKDNTNIGWLVGYYAQDDKETERTINSAFSHIEGGVEPEKISSIRKGIKINFDGKTERTYVRHNFEFIFKVSYGLIYTIKAYFGNGYEIGLDEISNSSNLSDPFAFVYVRQDANNRKFYDDLNNTFINKSTEFQNIFNKMFFNDSNFCDDEKYILSLNGKIFADDSDPKKKYQCRVLKISNNESKNANRGTQFGEEITNTFKSYLDSKINSTRYRNPCYEVVYSSYSYVVSMTPANLSQEYTQIKIAKTRNKLNDAPYDMFVAPYDLKGTKEQSFKYTNKQGKDQVIKINNDLTLATIRGMISQLGGTGNNKFIYDVQYLPFCPIEELRQAFDGKTYNITSLLGFLLGQDFEIIERTDGGEKPTVTEVVGFIAWATKSSGTLNIPIDIKVSDNNIERKIENETKLVRLVSPNYNGIFEFSPAKNNGVHYINVDYTYKPYAPYLHLNPDFSGLYGKDFNDDRGLIVGGDFSIPAISDNFINYALNNKNYQEIFNREIKHMDFTHNLNIEQQQIATGINAVTGLIGGATAGAMVGGVGGAIAGGLVGGIGSAIGGAVDINYANIQHRENKAYQTDMYTFNLGNIKAQPQSLSKTTPFTFNNKIFPFIEEYDATEEEKQSLRLKLKYNGMNVFKIDILSNYIHEDDKSFFKGQLIRVNDLGDDYNMACAIYSELDKGVYM